ncbi:Mu-like prophage major head subunit gpT family protein [Polymorphum gilvum]|uniref:Mu-like prophage major head subunit gpT n=1 Tax=Polymorphum gilvum (strain LMG 25793 / CGMCC 1.9160 / SL003B-26A1) TaxID=991905 RepID=F2J644_POLGS|nr:Mu-like prophage major head subunit gpT family protein [Polymorphum gilvum]ADZ72408.1 Mu-like prophage major head subunit gpT [Polymorphum gilvum SL003B-26A1]
MIINQQSLDDLFRGFSRAYQHGFDDTKPHWPSIATMIPSSTRENSYAWLGKFPKLREWIGSRTYETMQTRRYTVLNRKFEGTIEVDADDIADDNLGIYAPLFTEMGRAAAAHPDELIFEHLANAFEAECYDGQPFFDTDHPVLDPQTRKEVSVSNMQAGANPAWYLMDTRRALKPLIYQKRRDYRFVRKDDPKTSDRVFDKDKYAYGVDGRAAAGFGFWQMAYGSKQELTKETLRAARTAMKELKSDEGRPLGIVPNIIVVGNSNSDRARDLLLAEREASGATNTDRGLLEIVEIPHLA